VRALDVQGIGLIGVFLGILLFGELYAWRKGDLKWR
jgi:NADH:ubiquinone oxidoreductase subunit 3 (subunit A)